MDSGSNKIDAALKEHFNDLEILDRESKSKIKSMYDESSDEYDAAIWLIDFSISFTKSIFETTKREISAFRAKEKREPNDNDLDSIQSKVVASLLQNQKNVENVQSVVSKLFTDLKAKIVKKSSPADKPQKVDTSSRTLPSPPPKKMKDDTKEKKLTPQFNKQQHDQLLAPITQVPGYNKMPLNINKNPINEKTDKYLKDLLDMVNEKLMDVEKQKRKDVPETEDVKKLKKEYSAWADKIRDIQREIEAYRKIHGNANPTSALYEIEVKILESLRGSLLESTFVEYFKALREISPVRPILPTPPKRTETAASRTLQSEQQAAQSQTIPPTQKLATMLAKKPTQPGQVESGKKESTAKEAMKMIDQFIEPNHLSLYERKPDFKKDFDALGDNEEAKRQKKEIVAINIRSLLKTIIEIAKKDPANAILMLNNSLKNPIINKNIGDEKQFKGLVLNLFDKLEIKYEMTGTTPLAEKQKKALGTLKGTMETPQSTQKPATTVTTSTKKKSNTNP